MLLDACLWLLPLPFIAPCYTTWQRFPGPKTRPDLLCVILAAGSVILLPLNSWSCSVSPYVDGHRSRDDDHIGSTHLTAHFCNQLLRRCGITKRVRFCGASITTLIFTAALASNQLLRGCGITQLIPPRSSAWLAFSLTLGSELFGTKRCSLRSQKSMLSWNDVLVLS